MPQLVTSGAMLMCSMGMAPGTLNVLPMNMVNASAPAANIMDSKPMVNIATFGMCQSPSNPVVATATAAALGVLTPMPCIPNTVAPWSPGCSIVKIKNMPALNSTCTCNCLWGGTITISSPGQAVVSAT